MCYCVQSYDFMFLLSFVFLTRKLHTWVFMFQTNNMSPPSRCPPEWGWGVGRQWHKCPIVNTASLSLEETITWGHQKISYDINPASPAPPHPHAHAHMHAFARLPIIPLFQITSHFHEQLRQSNRWRVWSVCGSCQDPLCLSFTPSTLLLGAEKKLTWVLWSELIMYSIICACM